VLDASGAFAANDTIGLGDPRTIEKMPHKRYAGNFEAGVTYEIEMKGNGLLTPALLVYDDARKLVAETQRQRALPSAHVLFRPTRSGSFQIQACAPAGTGQYMLKVRRCDNVVVGS